MVAGDGWPVSDVATVTTFTGHQLGRNTHLSRLPRCLFVPLYSFSFCHMRVSLMLTSRASVLHKSAKLCGVSNRRERREVVDLPVVFFGGGPFGYRMETEAADSKQLIRVPLQ